MKWVSATLREWEAKRKENGEKGKAAAVVVGKVSRAGNGGNFSFPSSLPPISAGGREGVGDFFSRLAAEE